MRLDGINFWRTAACAGRGVSYTEEFVRANAGVDPAVTVGYTGTPGYTGSPVSRTAVVLINSRADITTALIPGLVNENAAGTEVDPYVIDLNWYHVTGTAITVDDASADSYVIKLTNSDFSLNTVGCISINMAGVFWSEHNRYNQAGLAGGDAVVAISRGTLRSRFDLVSDLNGDNWIKKTGADAIVDAMDFSVASAVGYGSGTGLIRNTATGGSISLDRYTLAGASWSGPLFYPDRPTTLSIQRGDVNLNDAAGFASLVPTYHTILLENWALPVTIKNNRVRCGTISNQSFIIGNSDNSNVNTRSIRNWTIEHNYITAINGRLNAQKMISFGLSTTTDVNFLRDVVIRLNRFRKDPSQNVAGNEIVYLMRPGSGCIMEGNLCDECGEDFLEFQQPLQGGIIRWNAGGDDVSTQVGGNIVDFYGAGAPWTAAGGNQGGHILGPVWGKCGADAWIVDAVNGVTVSGLMDADNSAGGFAANPPAANGRLHARGANSLDGVTVTNDMSPVVSSFDGRPCYLTREQGAATTILLPDPVTPLLKFTVNSTTGMAIGQLIMVELDATSSGGTRLKHQTTIFDLTGVTVTLTTAMPSAASATRVVQYQTAYNAGTVSWYEWVSGSPVLRDGTGGGVDGMAT